MRDPAEIHPISLQAVNEHYALQKPDELTFLLCLLEKDDIVVEVGCDAGGTSWAIQQVGVKRHIGIDLPGGNFSSGLAWSGDDREMIWGDSHDPKTKQKLRDVLGTDAPTVVLIDGDHTYTGVSEDFRMYGRQLSLGLVFFHDIVQHQQVPECQVDKFYNEVKDRYPHTEYISPNDDTWGGIGVLDLSYSKRLEDALQ